MLGVSQLLLCKKIYEFLTLIYLFTDLYFLCEMDTVIGHANMYLVKINSEKNWHVPCLAEESDTFLR